MHPIDWRWRSDAYVGALLELLDGLPARGRAHDVGRALGRSAERVARDIELVAATVKAGDPRDAQHEAVRRLLALDAPDAAAAPLPANENALRDPNRPSFPTRGSNAYREPDRDHREF